MKSKFATDGYEERCYCCGRTLGEVREYLRPLLEANLDAMEEEVVAGFLRELKEGGRAPSRPDGRRGRASDLREYFEPDDARRTELVSKDKELIDYYEKNRDDLQALAEWPTGDPRAGKLRALAFGDAFLAQYGDWTYEKYGAALKYGFGVSDDAKFLFDRRLFADGSTPSEARKEASSQLDSIRRELDVNANWESILRDCARERIESDHLGTLEFGRVYGKFGVAVCPVCMSVFGGNADVLMDKLSKTEDSVKRIFESSEAVRGTVSQTREIADVARSMAAEARDIAAEALKTARTASSAKQNMTPPAGAKPADAQKAVQHPPQGAVRPQRPGQ